MSIRKFQNATIASLLMLMMASCQQPNTSLDKENAIGDTVLNKKTDATETTSSGLNKAADSLKKEVNNRALGSNIFVKLVGRWVFVKSFLGEGRSIDATSFSIIRRNVESVGYAYFVRFPDSEQNWVLTEQDSNTVTYSDGYGIFAYDYHTGYLRVKISDISDSEYKKAKQ